MLEISRQPMITQIRCQECRAELVINSDSRRMTEKSITEYQKHHHCREEEKTT